MKFGVGVLTHNAIKHFRFDLLEQTIESLRVAFPGVEPFVFDNGSTDGSAELVEAMPHGFAYKPSDGNTSPGRGMNIIAKHLLMHDDVDIVVHSDDDMLWKPGATEKLINIFASHGSSEVALVSGYLEPCWDWNEPRKTIDCVRATDPTKVTRILVRDTAPACAWAYFATDHSLIFPLLESFGQDVDACKRIRSKNMSVAQLDLAEHKGWDFSTWNNRANVGARPLDKKKWGME